MAFLRFMRDNRGYEHFSLVEATTNRRGKSRTRLLYWYRTPPNVRVGREPFDESVRRALEAQNPGVQFDWRKIVETPIPSAETERWRERRRAEKAEKAARRAAVAAATGQPRAREEVGELGEPTELEALGEPGEPGEPGEIDEIDDVHEIDESDESLIAAPEIETDAEKDVAARDDAREVENKEAIAEADRAAPAASDPSQASRRRRRRRRRRGRSTAASSTPSSSESSPAAASGGHVEAPISEPEGD
jgi:hypothetical protein